MARVRKTASIAPETALEVATEVETMNTNEVINITEYCKVNNISEQTFRLTLSSFDPDNFDNVKVISATQANNVIAALAAHGTATNSSKQISESKATQGLVLENASNSDNETKTPETQPQQGTQVENALATASNNGLAGTKGSNSGSNITLLDELIAASEEEIKLADLVSQFKVQQILQNAAARDTQLVDQLRNQRLNTRAGYFDALRGLQSTTIDRPDITPDDLDFDAEVTRLSNELGKQLTINV